MSTKHTLIDGVECAKNHSGNHSLHRTGKYFACQGCGEYYTPRELSEAKSSALMLSRGVKAVAKGGAK